jgi:transcriptional regulator with XRE-family HTH domain
MDELKIVKKIRSIRLQRKLTLQQVADRTGFTRSYLSMLESGKKSPPIATLSRIARALDVDIAAFFEQKTPENRITVVLKGEREVVVRDGSTFGYVYESVAPAKRQKIMEPFVITHPPGIEGSWSDHEGEEFLYVLEGKVRFFYGEKEYILEEGDCIYFDGSIRHRGDGIGDGPAKTLVVISQPAYSSP